MKAGRENGFSLNELVVVIAILGILAALSVGSWTRVQDWFALKGARATMTSLHQRARVMALEKGETAKLHVDPVGDSVWVSVGGSTVERALMATDHIDIQSSVGSLTLCMSPRGFAQPSCNSFTTTVQLNFVVGQQSVPAQLRPMGKLVF